MAGIADVFSFLLTVTLLGGALYAIVYLVQAVNRGVARTKADLKSKGMDISSSGVSVKTDKNFDRQDYLDATQRGIMRAMDASSFRQGDGTTGSPADMARSEPGGPEKRRHRLFKKKVDP